MTILSAVWEFGNQEIVLNKTVCAVIGVTFFTLFTISGAYIRLPLPFTPVPVTLQTFTVLLAGAVLGRKLGISSQVLYVALGCTGLPVFANAQAGLLYLMGPTGGYLIGFALAAWVIGLIIGEKKAGFIKILSAMFLGEVILFSLVWLGCQWFYTLGFIRLSFWGFYLLSPGISLSCSRPRPLTTKSRVEPELFSASYGK